MVTCRFYKQRTLPRAYRKQILNRRKFNKLCQGQIPYKWTSEELPKSFLIGVALRPVRRSNLPQEVVAFMLVYDHKHVTELDGRPRPVCRRKELYLNLMCSGLKGAGSTLLKAFYKKAKTLKKKVIRLYALEGALAYWAKHGFIECDDPEQLMGCYRRRYRLDRTGGFRMTKVV